jgi:FAD synthase
MLYEPFTQPRISQHMGGLERTVGLVGPYRFLGKVVEGFKRGSKELGWPTANLDPASFEAQLDKEQEGVYLGWAAVEEDGVLLGGKVHKAVLSIGTPRVSCLLAACCRTLMPALLCRTHAGWNPFYKNEQRTVESYLCHDFGRDFYGADMRLLVCACIRPQADFSSMDELIKAIREDIEFGDAALGAPPLAELEQDGFFTGESKTDSSL